MAVRMCNPGGNNVTTGQTHFMPPGQTTYMPVTTEASVQVNWRTAGTFSGMYIRLSANAATSPSTQRFRIGGVNGNEVNSIPAGTTGEFFDSIDTDVVSVGNLLAIQVTNGGGGTLTVFAQATTFSPNAGTVQRLGCNVSVGTTNSNTTAFAALAGTTTTPFTATEANAQFEFQSAGTLQNLQAHVSANAKTTTTTVNTRKGGVNGLQTLSITTGATGIFRDDSNTDTTAVADLWNYSVVFATDTASITFQTISVEFSSSAGQFYLMGNLAEGRAGASSLNSFIATGGNVGANTTESFQQTMANLVFTVSELECFVSANTIAASSTIRVRRNAISGTSAVSITSSGTGWFIDSVDSDVFAIQDEINFQIQVGVSATHSLTYNTIGMLVSIPVDAFIETGTYQLS